jgi:hypothetical protein
MASRQERRRAERDAAKRRQGQAAAGAAAGAAGAEVAAAAFADLNVEPLGDWTTQASDPAVLARALGVETVRRRADEGDRAAQYSHGCLLMVAAEAEDAGLSGAAGLSSKAKVGLALVTSDAHQPSCVEGRPDHHHII